MIVAGIGCRRGSTADDVQDAVLAALRQAGRCGIDLMATIPRRADEPGLREAAQALGTALAVPEDAALRDAAPHCLTRSAHALALTGLPSVAECAALAGAGLGARLLGPRLALGGVTCALAESP